MVVFEATIKKFEKQGEKTGWTYIPVPADLAEEIKPGNKQSFRVKGKLDQVPIRGIALLPMGAGEFIMALNTELRKRIGKKAGAMLRVQLTEDTSEFLFNRDFLNCLADEPGAAAFFKSLPGSHQRYFSKWVDSAKTEPTRIKRISMAVNALAKKWGYTQMMRSSQGKT